MIRSTNINGVDVYVHHADSRVDDIYAAAGFGKTIAQIGRAEGADVASNLAYAEYKIKGVPIGRNVVAGKAITADTEKTMARDSLFMLPDKTMHIGRPPAGAIWALQGSPPLLKDGADIVVAGIERDQLGTDIWANNAEHLRIAYGLKSPYELVIVRTLAEITLKEMAAIMLSLGCVNAINGDGGGSATLYPADSGNGRKLGAALIIKEGTKLKLIGDQKPELVIDPGHGGKDPGASGNGIVEKELTLAISLYQFERFKALGVPVALTRNTDITLEEDDRVALVANSGAKYCISNHNNAAPATSALAKTSQGVEVIHSIYNNGQLARAIVEAIAVAGQLKRPTPIFCKQHPTITKADYYYMHRRTGDVTTNIIEYDFVTHPDGAARLKANWKIWAEAVVKAYCTYTGRKYTPPVAPQLPVTQQPGQFSDVPANHWAAALIKKYADRGVVVGYPDGTFKPDSPPTRAEMLAVFDRLKL